EHDLIAPTRLFVVAQIPGMLGCVVYMTVKSFLQAYERTTPALLAALVANIVNVVVCNLLVRGDEALVAFSGTPHGLPKLGALGAGLASSIAMSTLAAWVLIAAWRLRPKHTRVSWRELPIRKALRLGTPIGLQLLAEIGVFSVVAVLAGKLGHIAV